MKKKIVTLLGLMLIFLNITVQAFASNDYPHYVSGSANSQSFICLINNGSYQNITITFDQAVDPSRNPRFNQSTTDFAFTDTSPIDFLNNGTDFSTPNTFKAPVEVGGRNPGYYSMWFNWGGTGIAAPFQVVNTLAECKNPLITPPSVNSIPNATINVGGTYTTTGSFTDSNSSSWTGTVDYGDGVGSQNLSLNVDKTFTLSHVYNSAGKFTITVKVTNDQGAIGYATATVIVLGVPTSVSVDYPHYVSGTANSKDFLCFVNDGTYQDFRVSMDQVLAFYNPRYNQSTTGGTFSNTVPLDFLNNLSGTNDFQGGVLAGVTAETSGLTPGYYSMWFNWGTSTPIAAPFQVVSDLSQCSNPLSAPKLVTAIDAGGDTQGNYVADTDYSGGSPYTSSATVDTSGVSNPPPQAVYQSVRYGNTFSYTIPNLTPGGNYTVRLHFNELYWGTTLSGNAGGLGSRVFNVAINQTTVLNNYDIYQKAGGANIATTEQFPATPDSNGNITILFTTHTDNAMVNGIEVYSGTLPSPTPTPTPTPATSVLINTGGSAVSNFVADNSFSGGTTYSSTASVDTSGVANPAPEAVYQSVRYGDSFFYHITNLIPNTNYHVNLHFNELYWGTDLAGNAGGIGSRVFNVVINNNNVLNNFDIFQAAGGANKAIVEPFTATSDSNGAITISFTKITDNAMINGIEIYQ